MTRSQYGDRDTTGTIALKALQSKDIPCAGDLGHELLKSLVDDLNDSIASNPFQGRPFYIIIHEKKDAQFTNTILRRMICSEKRPYPEPNTSVFKTNPRSEKTLFCWSLPHQTVFIQVLLNPDRYGIEQVNDIKAYKAEKMEYFGFQKIGEKNGVPIYQENPHFKDRELNKKPQSRNKILLFS